MMASFTLVWRVCGAILFARQVMIDDIVRLLQVMIR
jgi:hypothetical protein